MSTLLTVYVVGAGVTLTTLLVAFSVEAHREKLGLAPATPDFEWKDFWMTVLLTGLWFLIVPLLIGAGIHEFVIGAIVKKVFAGELMAKKLKSGQ